VQQEVKSQVHIEKSSNSSHVKGRKKAVRGTVGSA